MQPTTRRAFEVATVLARHGARACAALLYSMLSPSGRRSRSSTVPVHVRRALEELGPTFMKLGQVLSTRPDLVPPAYEAELSRLQDAGPHVPTADIVAAIESALGRPLRSLYGSFDRSPIAAASIGQVHAATLADGTDVVVKVRRPHVVALVEIDLELLQRVAAALARRSVISRRYDPVALAREFAVTLRAELDYEREATNAEAVAREFRGNHTVHVPTVCRDLTTDGVITEGRVRGIKVDDVAALDAAGLDRRDIAARFADAYLSMVFVHRFFHADPHPGNVFVERDGRIGFVDFGMVGAISDRTGRALAEILLALAATDARRLADGLFALGVARTDIDREGLRADLEQFLQRYAHLPLERLAVRVVLGDLMAVVRAHRLRLPSDIALLLKTVMMCEGVAAQLDPQFELLPRLVPFAAGFAAGDPPPGTPPSPN